MKRIILIAMAALGGITASAANNTTINNTLVKNDKITTTFLVSGNCGMCKKTIENAALKVSGVSEANWDSEKKQITVTFDDSKTSLEKIHQAIADSGYDTELIKAQDLTYNKLPGCCQYNRGLTGTEKDKSIKKSSCCHK